MIDEWTKSLKIKARIKSLRGQYHLELVGDKQKGYEIMDIAKGGGHYWVVDYRGKPSRSHISNPQTMRDLGFYSVSTKFVVLTNKQLRSFMKLPIKEKIWTQD